MKRLIERASAAAMDAAMCAMMNRMQWKLRAGACTREAFDEYVAAWDGVDRESFYALPDAVPDLPAWRSEPFEVAWPSPLRSGFGRNDTARALVFPSAAGAGAPCVFLLHALMSASDIGYRRIAARFNARGWTAVFPHLPYHYSRTPEGWRNGALAVTANLPRNAEAIRQAVVELRQLAAVLRGRGCGEFGMVATSFGGWVGSLLSFLEEGFRFIALLQPIVDTDHAIWENPSAAAIRRILRANGIRRDETVRHSHLSSPLHGRPRDPAERVILVSARYDQVSPPAALQRAAEVWGGGEIAEVSQGHFGYRAMREALARVDARLGYRPIIVNE